MNQLTPLTAGSVPAHIAQSKALNLNDNAAKNWTSGFKVISIQGKDWWVGDELLKDDRGAPVSTLDVVIVGVASAVSKAYYPKEFIQGEKPKPTCMSIDGITPDAAAPVPQHTSCKICPHNEFGTAKQGKGKACRDARRIALVPAGNEANEKYGGPMLLRLPPTSIKQFIKYTEHLRSMGADVSQVITTMSFAQVPHPEVVFREADWLRDPVAYDTVMEHARSDAVHHMLNEEMAEVIDQDDDDAEAAASPLQTAPRPAHVAPAQPAQPAPAPAQAAATAVAVVQRRASPFGKSQGPAGVSNKTQVDPGTQARINEMHEQQAAPAKTNGAAPTPAPQETVVQGAPKDMETIIDSIEDLLK